MSINEEKKFVLKHTFLDVENMSSNVMSYGKIETHLDIPWRIYFVPDHVCSMAILRLDCLQPCGGIEWSIGMTIETKVIASTGEVEVHKNDFYISNKDTLTDKLAKLKSRLNNYLVNENLTVEFHVTINKVTGIEMKKEKKIFKKFDDESAKKFSDVIFSVKDQKFHVCKMYLAGHSTYFESLLFGNFEESKQSEIELKDIDPQDFQKFLEVLHGEPALDDKTVEGILKLADMYNAKTAIRHCEMFLIKYSKLTLKENFLLATQYKLGNLKKKCMSEFKNVEDIASIIPDVASQFDYEVWKELLNLSVQFSRNRQ